MRKQRLMSEDEEGQTYADKTRHTVDVHPTLDQKAGGSSPSEGTKNTFATAPKARRRLISGCRSLVDDPFTIPTRRRSRLEVCMDRTEEAVALIGICIAVIGYFVKYRSDLKLAQRNDRLERINRQLSEFYGPLLALTRSSGQSWHAFRHRYRPPVTESFWKIDPPPTREDTIAWQLWMTTVFMPVHQRMMGLGSTAPISSKSQRCLHAC